MMINNALTEFFLKDYPKHLCIEDRTIMPLKKEASIDFKFEIRDQKQTIIQQAGEGVSVIQNLGQRPLEIIDFEGYIDQFNPKGKKKKDKAEKCDFIICPATGSAFILFNELTECKLMYIEPYEKPTTGEKKDGKREKARKQLAASIERFYAVGNLLDTYEKKVALFSYRLTDEDEEDEAEKSMRRFMMSANELESDSSINQFLPHGFTFEQRLYPTPYIIE